MGKDKFAKSNVDEEAAKVAVATAPLVSTPPPSSTVVPTAASAKLDEADALRLEKFGLQLENLQLQANQIVSQRDSFNGYLIQKYSINPEHDAVDLPTRTIQRGVKK